jgi:hypothetical protein
MLIQYRSRDEEAAAPTAVEVLGGTLCGVLALAAVLFGIAAAAVLVAVPTSLNSYFGSTVARAMVAVLCFLAAPFLWRYAAMLLQLSPDPRHRMRFSERMRRTMAAAVFEVARRDGSSLETHHLLLGLLSSPPNTAVTVLEGMGIDPTKLSAELDAIEPRRREVDVRHVPVPREMPGARTVLHWAVQEADAADAKIVGTEHLLLALAREHFGHAGRVLRDAGADAGAITDALASLRERCPTGSLPEMIESNDADDTVTGSA